MMKAFNAQEIEKENEIPIYPKRGITITRGNGALLYDNHNHEFVDLVGGIGVANIGHSHPDLVEAITTQAKNLITCPEIFSNDKRAELIKKLVEITSTELDQVYLCNSGTEAVEAAIKFARIATRKTEVISAMRGFHGRTMGALSGTFNKKYRQPFGPLVPGFKFAPFNKLDKLKSLINDNTAAILLEIVQGNGGIHIADQNYLQEVRRLCDAYGIILIFDEVQTGFCRTGKMFAYQNYDVTPDILCLAKAIGGGVPLGSTIVNSTKISIGVSLHGSTFGGNPLAAAAGLKTIEIMEKQYLSNRSNQLGNYFKNRLENISSPLIRDIRQIGLMIGLELRIRVYPVLEQLQNEGILAGPAGSTVIRFLPPLVITKKQIDFVIEKLTVILSSIEE